MVYYRYIKLLGVFIWGCNGFDGDDEAGIAGSDEFHLKQLKFLKINANNELAYAA